MPEEREIAGLRCGEVLQVLSDYLDGTLPPGLGHTLEAHLAGCDLCERFGGRFARAVELLRRELASPGGLPDHVLSRLRDRLRRETGG